MNRDESLERDLKEALRPRAVSNCPGEERLLAFYRGGLPEAEVESVREHLAGCASCVDLARDARAFLAAWEASPATLRPSSLRWLAAAAVLLVAAFASIWVLRHRPAPPSPGLAPEAAAPAAANPWRNLPVAAAAYRLPRPEDELVFRSPEEAPPAAAFVAAMAPYARGDYGAADLELGRFLRAHPGQAEASFYRGVSLLILGKSEEAAKLLKSAASSPSPLPEAAWYLALALLKSGETEAALVPLDEVGQKAGPHQAHAAQLAGEVRRVRDRR